MDKYSCASYRKRYPWRNRLSQAKQRCTNSKDPHYKTYGSRGINFFLTMEEGKELWFRDKAYEMKRPSLDRKDNNGNYDFLNCQFIELGINIGKDRIRPVLQYDLQGNFIKEWKSATEAANLLLIKRNNIVANCRKCSISSYGFIWKYKIYQRQIV